jgi:hypothetical protein
MILKKAPPRYKRGDLKSIVKFAFKPVQLIEIGRLDHSSFDLNPNILGELIWLERYVETYQFGGINKEQKEEWYFIKSERYGQHFLNKLCE